MILRAYRPDDFLEVFALFKETVQRINRKDYSEEQIKAWLQSDPAHFQERLLAHKSYVVIDQKRIVGFGDIDDACYLDHLYVAADAQRKGIATRLMNQLEKEGTGSIYTDVSITARPFFERRNYKVLKRQTVLCHGVYLDNYKMVLERD